MAFVALQCILVVNVVYLMAFVRNHYQLLAGLFALLGAIGVRSSSAFGATFFVAYPTTDFLGLGSGGFVLGYGERYQKSNGKQSQCKFLHYQFISSSEFRLDLSVNGI